MKIAVVIGSLAMGGGERVASELANRWAGLGNDVTILTLAAGDVSPFYPLDARVRVVPLGLAWDSPNALAGLASHFVRVRAARKALGAVRPDVVLGIMDGANVVAAPAARQLGIPVIVSEHRSPYVAPRRKAWNAAMLRTYRGADMLVVLTKVARDHHRARGLERVRQIPNPVFAPDTSGEPEIDVPSPVVAAMGRLVALKGFDSLIRSFARLRRDHPDWHLLIMGEGEERQRLEQVRESHGIGDSVHLPGRVERPSRVLARADLFALTSTNEGFPMALCEAMACGAPAVSTDCETGPREIIREGVDGFLVPVGDEPALADALGKLMSDSELRKRMGARAAEICQRFDADEIVRRWLDLFQECIDSRRGQS